MRHLEDVTTSSMDRPSVTPIVCSTKKLQPREREGSVCICVSSGNNKTEFDVSSRNVSGTWSISSEYTPSNLR
jgi:hypothetical protein